MSPLRPWLAGLGCLLLAIAGPAQPLAAGRSDRVLVAAPTAVEFPGAEAAAVRIAVQCVDARTGEPLGGAPRLPAPGGVSAPARPRGAGTTGTSRPAGRSAG